MCNQTKIGICPYCGRRHSSGRDSICAAEFNGWQMDYALRAKKDYEGLIAHHQAVVAWRPDDLHALYRLGEAFVLNGEPEKAIELLSEPHRKYPNWHDFQHVLLDALFALGKDETDFEWAEEIPVHRIGKSVLDRCHAWLKPKRKPRNAYDLHHPFEIDGYCLFTPKDLLEAIRRDDRFVVEEEDVWSPIRLSRGRSSIRQRRPQPPE